MERLNYHHLFYFWTVAREGSLVAAGKTLRLSHPTLSAQIRALEAQLGADVFERVGRRLVLTETGRVVFRYADEIFSLGRELVDTVKGREVGRSLRLDVGIVDVLPKLVVRRLLAPALALAEPVRLVCYEDSYEKLLADLALLTLDLVIADAPVPVGSSVRAFPQLLGESGITFFGTRRLARQYRPGFPRSLDGAPLLLPLEHLPSRRALGRWLERRRVRVRVVAEFEDSALLKAFGADGAGVFPGPTVIEDDIARQYNVEVIGRAPEVRERFYALSAQRKLKNAAALAVCEAARSARAE